MELGGRAGGWVQTGTLVSPRRRHCSVRSVADVATFAAEWSGTSDPPTHLHPCTPPSLQAGAPATRAGAAAARSDEGLKAVVAAYEAKQAELGKENRDLKAALASLQVGAGAGHGWGM